MEANVDTRKLAKSLRYLPKSELERYCRNCGMTEREMFALLDYIYSCVKQTELCERL